MNESSDQYGIVKLPSNRIGDISTRTYDMPGNGTFSFPGSWLVLEMGNSVGELSFEGNGGADLAENIGQALIKGAEALRQRIRAREASE